MVVDLYFPVARASAEMTVRAPAGHLGVCCRDVDITVDFVDRDRPVTRSSADRPFETLETDFPIGGTQGDFRVARHAEFDVGDCASGTLSRNLNLDLENVAGI